MRSSKTLRLATLATLAIMLALEVVYLRADTLFFRVALGTTAILFLAVGYAENEERRTAKKQRQRMRDVLGKKAET